MIDHWLPRNKSSIKPAIFHRQFIPSQPCFLSLNLLSVCWIGSGSQASFRELFNLSFSSFLGPHIITLEEEEEEDRNLLLGFHCYLASFLCFLYFFTSKIIYLDLLLISSSFTFLYFLFVILYFLEFLFIIWSVR